MPIVQINLTRRPAEKIEAMIKGVSEAIADSLGADIGTVRVIVNELDDRQYWVGGKSIDIVRSERNAVSR